MKDIILLAVAAVLCLMAVALFRNIRALRRLALSAAGGLAAFGAVNLTGFLTGAAALGLTPNLWTIGTAVLLGIPGVTGLMFVRWILGV